jgi:hypothetical protein
MPKVNPIIFVKTSTIEEILVGKKCCKNSKPNERVNPIIKTIEMVLKYNWKLKLSKR